MYTYMHVHGIHIGGLHSFVGVHVCVYFTYMRVFYLYACICSYENMFAFVLVDLCTHA